MLSARARCDAALRARRSSAAPQLPYQPAAGRLSWSRARAAPQAAPPKQSDLLATIDVQEEDIQNLTRSYCDDFVCTSSPAIEQTVRSLARELERGRYATTSFYQSTVTFSDGFRSFTGTAGFSRQRWLADSVDNLRVSITKMEMLDKGTARVSWRATGNLGTNPIILQFTTTVTMNLVTGRIETQKESWDLSRCALPAAAAATASRLAWALKQRVKDVQEGLNKATDKLGGTTGGDGTDSFVPGGTVDPTRFYQTSGGPNNDLFSAGLVVALLYLAFRFFGELENLH